ncbi:hypothetical protein BMS3Bbin02_02375 [bacterium BMS3Bbin02]|nr:hypothetical protein BMS3Bbin02_02375 [bacterium BMS3Bbin02]
MVEAYAHNARVPVSALLSEVREDRNVLRPEDRSAPNRFVLSKRAPMPHGRKSSTRKAGFIDGYMTLVADFYEDVVQGIVPWHPPAPKRKQVEPGDEADTIQIDHSRSTSTSSD